MVGKEAVEAYQREEAEKVLGPATQFLMRHGINPKSVATQARPFARWPTPASSTCWSWARTATACSATW
jgi:hypothetical protein